MIKIKYKLEKLVTILSIVFLTFFIFLTIFSHILLTNQHANFESECKKIIEKFNFYFKVLGIENFIKIVEMINNFAILGSRRSVLANIFPIFLSISYIFLSFFNKSSIKIENKICRRAAFFLVPLIFSCYVYFSLSDKQETSLSTANILIKITIYLYFFLLYYYSEKDYKKKTAYSIFLGVSVFCYIYCIIAYTTYWTHDKIDMGNPLTLCALKENLNLDDKVIEILTKNGQIDAIYSDYKFGSMFYRGRWIIIVPEMAVDYNGQLLHELKHCLIGKVFFHVCGYNIIYIFLTIFGAFFLFYYTKKPSNFAKRFFIFDIFLTIFISKLILFLRNNEENYCDDFAINHGYGKNIALYFIHDILCDVCDENLFPFFGTNFTNLFFDFSVHMPMINRLKKLLNIK